MFHARGKTVPAKKWQQKRYQTCNLYQGKFSDEFYDYCIENGIAHKFDHGIRISKDLAFVYMSLLADIISKRHEIEMFTDINHYDKFLLYKDRCSSIDQNIRYHIIKTQIEFLIPAKIRDIPLDTVIRLRTDRNFDTYRRAYIIEMEKYLKEREKDPNCSFADQLKIKQELQRILELSCGVTAPVVLSCSAFMSFMRGEASPAPVLASAYLDFSAIKQMHELPRYVREMRNKIQAKRYVGQIEKAYRSNFD